MALCPSVLSLMKGFRGGRNGEMVCGVLCVHKPAADVHSSRTCAAGAQGKMGMPDDNLAEEAALPTGRVYLHLVGHLDVPTQAESTFSTRTGRADRFHVARPAVS